MPQDLGGLLLSFQTYLQIEAVDADPYIYIMRGVLHVDLVFRDESAMDNMPDLVPLVRTICELFITAELA
jgi:hypothetical protein